MVTVLLGLHGLLAAWAVVGFAEWFAPSVPWPAISNELFPRDILLMQWSLVLTSAVVFIGGWVLKWRHTPMAMAGVYAGMAALCALQTFRYLESDLRFVALALEYAAYALILIYLFRSRVFARA
jgi:hypothetical protein